MATKLTADVLKRFTPLGGLKRQNLEALLKKTSIRKMDAGATLFKEGDTDKRTYFIVTGTVDLKGEANEAIQVTGETEIARSALSASLPRKHTARANDKIEFLSIDTDLLDVMLTWDQTGIYEVKELQDNIDPSTTIDDWMTVLLQTQAFHKIPPANIQAIFMRMQQVNHKAGDVIVKQGDAGDFFYVLVRGKCSVTRETPLNKDGIRLAELSIGDTFGEEALISESNRNATITMMTDGSVMRLGKDDFNTLLNEPTLDWVPYDEAKKLVADGAKWLDVRLPSEFEGSHEADAINIPLYFIRLKLTALDEGTTYVVCCDTGRRSSAGAFIMNEKGFTTKVLKGGLNLTDLNQG